MPLGRFQEFDLQVLQAPDPAKVILSHVPPVVAKDLLYQGAKPPAGPCAFATPFSRLGVRRFVMRGCRHD